MLRVVGNDVGMGVTIHNGVRLLVLSNLSIGSNSTINSRSLLDSRIGIKIGCNVMIGSNSKLFSLGHDVDSPEFESVGGIIEIGDNVVIFPNSLIMPGVNIGDNAVVYSGSVVTKDVKAGSIVGGNPAKVIRKRKGGISYKLSYKMYFGV